MRLAFLLFLFVFSLTAQNITGTILDRETNTPLEDVNVYIKSAEKGTVSNGKGAFVLQLQKQLNLTDIITFSSVGYATANYSFEQIKSLNFIIFLMKKSEQLDEITLLSEQEFNPKLNYKKLANLEESIHHFGSALVGHKIYIIGGDKTVIEETEKKAFNESQSFDEMLKLFNAKLTWEHYSDKLQVYDIDKDTVEISDLAFGERAYHNIVSVDDKLYVLGGKSLSVNQKIEYLEHKIEVLDLATNTLEFDETYPHQALNFASVAYQDNLIVMGGSTKLKVNRDKVYSDKSYIYNITSGYWYELANMTMPKEVNAVIVENKIYLIGGYNNKALKDIEYYNLKTGTWHTEGNLFYGIDNPALTQHDDVIYVYHNGKLLTFNVDTKVLNEYKIGLNLSDAALFYANNTLYIVGGSTELYYGISLSSGIYSIDLKEFNRTRILQTKTLK
ncbi:kelch repeat-containing protein [Formosa sp. PL04]|uniref:Kelch repeat-containing protein n=1 Tax=Formosa sp. PL04 TaxID=3081755 RepID=UPI002980A758|nr:kelch repeat-containing protein [Formosa sp. PL04]MDW5290399.1 kelch repeat-containing protein [Formosa sp. PL04]